MEVTKDNLNKIKNFLPPSLEEMDLKEAKDRFYVQTFIVADNMVNMGLGRWSQESLAQIPKILPGVKLMLDHEDKVSEIVGVVFDVKYLQSLTPPPDWILDSGGERIENLSIISKEGYARVEADCYILKSKKDVIEKIEAGEWDSISLTFNYDDYNDYKCPKCGIRLSECYHVLKSEKDSFPDGVELVGHYIKPKIKAILEMSIVYRGLNPATGLKTKRYSTG